MLDLPTHPRLSADDADDANNADSLYGMSASIWVICGQVHLLFWNEEAFDGEIGGNRSDTGLAVPGAGTLEVILEEAIVGADDEANALSETRP